MKKHLLFSIIYFILFSSCSNNQEGFVIIGQTANIKDSTLLYLENEHTPKLDSCYLIENRFEFKGSVDHFENLWIHTIDYSEDLSIWVENTTIHVDARYSSLSKASIKGSEIQKQSDELDAITLGWVNRKNQLKILRRKEKDSNRLKQIEDSIDIYQEQINEAEIKFISSHPNYEINTYFLTYLKDQIGKTKTRKLLESLDINIQNNLWGRSISLYLEKSVDLQVGDTAVNFTLQNLNGEDVSLSSYRGNYTLLDFWFSGCAGCEADYPYLLKAYKTYHNKGFEILGINMDKTEASWQSTVKTDSILWETVSELKGFNGNIPTIYNVHSAPTTYLLDAKGIVIAKDISQKTLLDKLENLYKE